MAEPKQVEAIPEDAVITIEVSGAFYARCAGLLQNYCAHLDPKAFAEMIQKLEKDGPSDSYEFDLVTIMTLTHEIESEARKQKVTKMMDLPESLKNDMKGSSPGS